MNVWPHTIARPAIAALSAYSARGNITGALHLDANESPWPPAPANASVKGYNRYPGQQSPQLRQRLSDIYGVTPDEIMIGRGADEAIDILLRTFCEANADSIFICPPTFGYFKVAAQIQGAKIIEVPQKGFDIDEDAVREALGLDSPKLVFLCSPNNPTGSTVNPDFVKELCTAYPDTLIVVDEAYAEFSSQPSFAALRPQFRNLIVLRTLSKAYGLAGVRVGCAIADPDVIALMLKVLPPYPLPIPVEKTALSALSPSAMAVIEARMTGWILERKRLETELAKSKYVETVYPSEANFLLLKIKDEDALLRALAKANVKLRDFRSKIPGCLRISVGTPEENTIALAAFGLVSPADKAERIAEAHRKTNETDIALRVNLDDPSSVRIETGLGFFDHMLEQISKHGGFGLTLACKGDLEIDAHHTVEDVALALGEALKTALGNKAGIGRYGFVMPMDETQARVAIDLSGRPAAVFNGQFPTDHVGEFPAEMCPHFFQSLAQTLGAAVHIDVAGDNTHHMIEACFKGAGRALKPAFARGHGDWIPSTKGVI